jgi:hypothetical protein
MPFDEVDLQQALLVLRRAYGCKLISSLEYFMLRKAFIEAKATYDAMWETVSNLEFQLSQLQERPNQQ